MVAVDQQHVSPSAAALAVENMTYAIRRAVRSDMPQIAQLRSEAFYEHEPEPTRRHQRDVIQMGALARLRCPGAMSYVAICPQTNAVVATVDVSLYNRDGRRIPQLDAPLSKPNSSIANNHAPSIPTFRSLFARASPSLSSPTSRRSRTTSIEATTATTAITTGAGRRRRRGKECAMYVSSMAVSRSHRRRGLGKTLLSRVVDVAEQEEVCGVYLHVDVQNPPAVRLYEAMRFKPPHNKDVWWWIPSMALPEHQLLFRRIESARAPRLSQQQQQPQPHLREAEESRRRKLMEFAEEEEKVRSVGV